MTTLDTPVLTARGIFGWEGLERRSGRYGAVGLRDRDTNNTAVAELQLDELTLLKFSGQYIRLVATVLEVRPSGHPHFYRMQRSVSLQSPSVGEQIDLGTGTLFTELTYSDSDSVTKDWLVFGFRPDDGQQVNWFDPEKLYRLHDQTVELTFFRVE